MLIECNAVTLLKDAAYVEGVTHYFWNFNRYRHEDLESVTEGGCGTAACFIGSLPDFISNDTAQESMKMKYRISEREYFYLFMPKQISPPFFPRNSLDRYSVSGGASKEEVIARVRKFAQWKLRRAHKIKQYYYERFSGARNGVSIANKEWIDHNVAVV